MSSAPRKQAARLPRPAARYWKGKVPKGADALASDSDESDDEQQVQEGEEGDVMIGGDEDEEDEEELEVREVQKVGAKKGMNVSLKDVSVSKEGRVTVAGKDEVGRTLAEQEEEEEEEEEAEEEEESSEEESSEEESEDEPPKPQFRPVFVPKRGRATIAEKEQLAQDTEEAQKKKELDAEERKKQSHDLVAESIKRELLEKEKEEIVPDIDDTDGLDPEGEFEAWRLRELARIKRDKEEELRRELEREEVERRRALPEEQRMKEDLEHAEQLRAEKPKGQQKFLQKYWHKGAFHQDEDILKRDYTEATASTMDVSLLPKVMQVKNFGKRSRTKYTHLLDQDTTGSASNFGGAANGAASGASTSGSGCFLCGGPHMKKDCPQNENLPPGKRPESNWQGNKRQDFGWQDRKQDSGWQSRPQKGHDRERPRSRSPPPVSRLDDRRERDRDNGRDWRRSRSRSPRRYDNRRRDDQRYKERRRSRSRSVEHDRDRDDKRRKIAG